MGWSSVHGKDLKWVVANCINEIDRKKYCVVKWKLIHEQYHKELWMLVTELKSGQQLLCLDLLEEDDKTGDWSWKCMDESVGPYYYGCPASYVKAATLNVNESWRKQWRAHNGICIDAQQFKLMLDEALADSGGPVAAGMDD